MLKAKLHTFKKHLIKEQEADSPPIPEEVENGSQHEETWKSFHTTPYQYEDEACLIREVAYPLQTKWGRYTFSELAPVLEGWRTLRSEHPLSSGALEAEDLLFFDTETTGLSSGAGHSIFLLGSSQVRDQKVNVRQYLLQGPGSEVAMYHYFLHHVKGLKNLVTYNGKAFDWPQVKTRHTLLRQFVPSLPAFGHFDLLHGSRRLWRDTLPSVRLAAVEEAILQIKRKHDVPGYLAPMLYFQYVKEQDPELIQGVMTHNEWDVLSLITLYIHLSYILQDAIPLSVKEQFEAARWFEAVGESHLARIRYEALLTQEHSLRRTVTKALAALLKKEKEGEQACRLWEELCQEEQHDSDVFIEVAKWYEHHGKDPEKALLYAQQGYAIYKSTRRIVRRIDEQERSAFEKRIERLKKKVATSKER
ncbi:hypothetical protein A374_03704 [Fictibacillus macauensis ZFHKF-1]|uniref:YprB ribonuclease H-like domain-containing protein n=1 Tax=Fictibacillus macauensis ZFHKF-1 TaxID=1196324 RepID=I8UIC6_9BACL|nr:ribonuclease H-like domain-containing protein [Fictibacillus macauensis]EIT86645.1 hypothetical protein A374_03704 [Fictibacillus macauensis ZFHKF-1]